jgi:hypothetical protein
VIRYARGGLANDAETFLLTSLRGLRLVYFGALWSSHGVTTH